LLLWLQCTFRTRQNIYCSQSEWSTLLLY
jgi:hypothetical protein